MNEHAESDKILRDVKYYGAENQSLKLRIEEYKYIDKINQNTILELRQRIVDFNYLQNKLNDAIVELGFTKSINEDFKKKLLLANKNEMNLQIELNQLRNFRHKLDEKENDYTNLKLQLDDTIYQLRKQRSQSLFLNEQISRIDLLESLLADAIQERDEWKSKGEK